MTHKATTKAKGKSINVSDAVEINKVIASKKTRKN